MESILIIVTVASLAFAIIMGGIVVKLLRDERRRSDRRAALLVELADETPTVDDPLADFEMRDDDVEPVPAVVSASDLFTAREEQSAWPRRLAVVGGLTIVIVITAAAIGLRPGLSFVEGSGSSTPETATGAPSSAAAAPEGSATRLDLMSLTHVEENGALKITGLVQNPRNGALVSKVTATAFLFGADGTFLASGRAPLDFTTLRAGDESGFVISVPVSVPVARYRVGFRGEDGRIIGHVDRRESATIARGPS